MAPPVRSDTQAPAPCGDAEHDTIREALARAQEELLASAERRTTKLVQANARLRASLASLRGTQDLELLIGDTLRSIAETIGAQHGTAWWLRGTEASLIWDLDGGRLLRAVESKHPRPSFTVPEGSPQRQWMVEAGERAPLPVVIQFSDAFGVDEATSTFLRQRGVKQLVLFPMALGEELVGLFGVDLVVERSLPPDEIELVQALANRASLAVALVRLGDEARAAAIARERELAAEQRALQAEELAQLSAVGRHSLQRLVASADFDDFLALVMRVAIDQLGAEGGGVYRIDENGRGFPAVNMENGIVRVVDEADFPPLAQDARPMMERLLDRTGGGIAIDDAQTMAALPDYEPCRDLLAAMGTRTTMLMPLLVGKAVYGLCVLRFRSDRRFSAAEVELAKSLGDQTVLAIELKRLTRAARAAAVTEERNRLARDIHDTLAQSFAAIIRQLESAAATPEDARRFVAISTKIARESLVEAQRSIRALRPSPLDDRSFTGALEDLVRRNKRMSNAHIRLTSIGEPMILPTRVEDEMVRIVHEALTNAVRHGNASSIEVELAFEAGSVRVTVCDDGCGFDTMAVGSRGVGLTSMRERARRVGASVTIASEPGSGTEVLAYWKEAEAAAL